MKRNCLRRALNPVLIICLVISAFSSGQALAQATAPAGPASPATADQPAAINAQLAQELASAGGSVSFLVILKDQVDVAALTQAGSGQAGSGQASTGQAGAARPASALARRVAVYAALTEHARRTQAGLWQWLDEHGVSYTPHYLANMVEVQGDAALAAQLRLRPEVARLARNPAVRTKQAIPTPPDPASPAAVQATQTLTYGLSYTHADQLWAQGIRGQGIVVAGQDTGVQWNHPALLGGYRGWNAQTATATHAYNWLDAFGRDEDDVNLRGCASDPQVPCDDNGHGTHTLGTVVGDATANGGTIIGMAPAAKWIACRNMRNNIGTPASYTTCFEFLLAPYPQGGDPLRDGRPELGAQVINNSWGCPPNEGCDADTLRQVVDTVRAAGIFIAASAGNEGPACSTTAEPIAIYDSAFTAGAHDVQGVIAFFSSRGPVTVDGSNRPKPDLSAPGVSIYSAYRNSTYTILSGTSMAAPHVAGAVALLWSAVPELVGDVDRTEQILLKSADPVATSECGPDLTLRSPNYVYGYGKLNVAAALALASQPVTFTLTIVNADGRPNPGTAVRLIDARTGYVYDGTADAAGQVQWASATGNGAPLAGSYQVLASSCLPLLSTTSVTLRPNESVTLTVTAPAYCQILPQVYRP